MKIKNLWRIFSKVKLNNKFSSCYALDKNKQKKGADGFEEKKRYYEFSLGNFRFSNCNYVTVN